MISMPKEGWAKDIQLFMMMTGFEGIDLAYMASRAVSLILIPECFVNALKRKYYMSGSECWWRCYWYYFNAFWHWLTVRCYHSSNCIAFYRSLRIDFILLEVYYTNWTMKVVVWSIHCPFISRWYNYNTYCMF